MKMWELIDATWRDYVRDHIPANLVKAAVDAVDFDRVDEAFWCVEMALDDEDNPRVVVNYGIREADNVPEMKAGRVLIACPIDDMTGQSDLLEFNASRDSFWDAEWVP